MKIRNARHEDIDPLAALLEQLFAIETDFRIDVERHRHGIAMMIDGCGKHRCMKVAEVSDRGVVAMGSAQLLISTAEGGLVALLEERGGRRMAQPGDRAQNNDRP